MIKKVWNVVKKTIGTKEIIIPICDKNEYINSIDSFSGGTLSGMNLLCLTNREEDMETVQRVLMTEKCQVVTVLCDADDLEYNLIVNTSANVIGSYDHIVNIIHIEENCDIVMGTNNSVADPLRMLYQWLQIESDYLIRMNRYGTICSVVIIHGETMNGNIFATAAESCIKGLGKVLAAHSILENGIVAQDEVPLAEVLHAVSYMSSKYGQILAGEVLKLR